ncbi:UBX domain-containing protein [Dorcoceras hygrometricum]|uniref:UBX domain-containing protein n=1 Tax=Dorcoceras hygrometricum TaxID=472368 RepID=A0A2Z7BDH6_9LAMI|nr:UBX domain-containing protein [Dorcoceras hygrometricum]
MGNTDPNKTKAGNKYEVKPQYEELSKQINMQHAINQCYECMRLSKEISQLNRPLQLGGRHSYPVVTAPTIALDFSDTTPVSPLQLGGRPSYPVVTAPTIALDFSGTTQQSASHNVAPKSGYQIKSQYPCSIHNMPKRKIHNTFNQNSNRFTFLNKVTETHDQATRFLLVQFTQQGLPGMLKSVTGTQNLSSTLLHNHANPMARSILRSYTSTQALTTKNRAQTTRNSHPKAQKKPLLAQLNETSNSRTSRAYGISQLVAPSFETSINGKGKSHGVQRHQERQKQRLDAMEIGGGKSR